MPTAAASPGPQALRRLRILTLAFVVLHVWHAVGQGRGGWRARHGGLGGAIRQFFVLSFDDPVLSAGLSDFAVVATVLGATMVYDLPPEQRRGWRLKVVLAVYALFPGLGALLFLVWLRPAARVIPAPRPAATPAA